MAASLSTKLRAANYDSLRRSGGLSGDLVLRDDDAAIVATITEGWNAVQASFEDLGGQILSVRIADLDEADYSAAVFFDWGGYRYEREGFATKPTTNPKEWIWRVRPVGAVA